MQKTGISVPALLDRLEALVPFAPMKSRKVGHEKTELAILLCEAKIMKAYLEPGCTSLPQLGRMLGLGAEVVKKYVGAGTRLRKKNRALYEAVITAVADGTQRPRLPGVSDLKAQGSREKQLGPDLDKMMSSLELGMPNRMAAPVIDAEVYGDSNIRGRRSLSAIDKFVADALRLEETLEALVGGSASDIHPHSLLNRRVSSVTGSFKRILALCDALLASPGPRSAGDPVARLRP